LGSKDGTERVHIVGSTVGSGLDIKATEGAWLGSKDGTERVHTVGAKEGSGSGQDVVTTIGAKGSKDGSEKVHVKGSTAWDRE
jgi:hypothetical protein